MSAAKMLLHSALASQGSPSVMPAEKLRPLHQVTSLPGAEGSCRKFFNRIMNETSSKG